MCIGAAKSGTTTLYDTLRQHANIFAPSFKEPHFFDMPSIYCHGLQWYQKTYFKTSYRIDNSVVKKFWIGRVNFAIDK